MRTDTFVTKAQKTQGVEKTLIMLVSKGAIAAEA